MLAKFKTYQLAVQLYETCDLIQAKSYLKDQLMRASLSVVLNLAEGNDKPTIKDKRRFFNIALGSLRETQACLMLLKRAEEAKIADQVGACLYRLTRG